MPIHAGQRTTGFGDHGLLELHSPLVGQQQWHSQDSILADVTHYKDLLGLHVLELYGQPYDLVEGQPCLNGHEPVTVTFF